MNCRNTLHLLPSGMKRLHLFPDVQHSPTPQSEFDIHRLCTLPSTIATSTIVMTTVKNKIVFPVDVFILFRLLEVYSSLILLRLRCADVYDVCCEES